MPWTESIQAVEREENEPNKERKFVCDFNTCNNLSVQVLELVKVGLGSWVQLRSN